MFALVDCNSCYASCEQIFRPDLRHKPVVVLSNNDGVIVARSQEAKRLNINELQPYFQQKDLLKKHNVAVFSSNYELYGDISQRVMNILQEYGQVEIYSIDEAFIDFSDLAHINSKHYGAAIKSRLYQDVKMPVCVGVAKSKTLAKQAKHIAKRSRKLKGVCVLEKQSTVNTALQRIACDKIWGIGRRLSQRLAAINIHTAYQLAHADPKKIRQQFSVNVERTVRELNGEACIELEHVEDKKHIVCSRSFGHKVSSQHELAQAVSQYASRACVKLRKQQSLCRAISVQVLTGRYCQNPYSNGITLGLIQPSDDSRDIMSSAKAGLERIYKPGYAYNKVAVGLIDLIDKRQQQIDLFSKAERNNSAALMQLMDTLNRRQKGQIFFASDGINNTWRMSRRYKSPSYTTEWTDIPSIGCNE